MLDYPLRPAKALRPALCVATCRALGEDASRALPSAAALELFHNACLVHDDVEDSSLKRRNGPTLHVVHGVPVAVNVGDGMLAIALEPLLQNVRDVGLGPALNIFKVFCRMARESVEGQMLELGWARERRWNLEDRDYLRMVHKKTGWYSFIAPVQMGSIVAKADRRRQSSLGRFALCLGIAFQIQDDLLGLERDEATIGKDALSDLWEGKYTLPLLHALRVATRAERDEALGILALSRGAPALTAEERLQRKGLLEKIETRATDLDPNERALLRDALIGQATSGLCDEAVAQLHAFVSGRGGSSLAYARSIARRYAERAARSFDHALGAVPDSVHKAFLSGLVDFVVERTR
jgi:geranylgeranyl diphosphate synthase type II